VYLKEILEIYDDEELLELMKDESKLNHALGEQTFQNFRWNEFIYPYMREHEFDTWYALLDPYYIQFGKDILNLL